MTTTFDDILKNIGEFGSYQKRLYFLLCLPCLTLAALLVLNVFLLGVPHHRCKIPGLDNDTYSIQDSHHEQLINDTIPPDSDEKYTYDRCHYYVTENGNETQPLLCSEWVYDTSVYKNTFAQKLNMVCDDAIKIPNAQMIFFFGVLFGSLFYGQISDIIGRRKTLYLCILVQLGSSLGLIGMVEYIGFCVLLFVLGGAVLGLYMTSYVIGMELVGPSARIFTGNIMPMFLTTGVLYLVLMVYLIREWIYFTLAVSLPAVLFLPYYWVVPESVRWLLSKGKNEEALKVLRKVAHNNKKTLDEKLIDELPTAPKEGRVWSLFSNRTIATRTLIIYFNWFVCSMSYYGVVLNIGNLGGDLYLNFVLLTIVEYPAKFFAFLLMNRIGRKKLHMAFLIFGGLFCMGTIWPIMDGRDELHIVLIAFSMIGKMCVTGAFDVIYVLSSELYPTVVRNAGMGSSSAVARIGSMLAPYIANSANLVSGVNGQAIPLTLFGAAMFIAGLSTIALPETTGRQLPDSIEDAIHFNKQKPKVPDVYVVPVKTDGDIIKDEKMSWYKDVFIKVS